MADISQIKLPDNTTYDIKSKSSVAGNIYVGTCSTAAATAAKVVTISADQNFKLKTGSMIIVKFTESNSASSVTLNVNSTGAKSIYYNNAVYTAASTSITGYANAYLVYVYDGTNWVWQGHGADSNTTYSAMSVAEGKTGTATSGRSMRADYLKQIIQYHAVPSGQGVPSGGTAGQVLSKVDGTNYNTEWIDAPSGGIEWEDKDPTTFAIADLPAKDVFYHFPSVTYSTASALYQNIIPLISSASKTYECFMHGIYIKDTSTKRIFMFDILFSPNIPDASNKVEGLRMIGGNSFDLSTGSVSNPTTYKMCTPFCGFNLQRLDYNTSTSAITIGTISGTNDSNKSVANILMKTGGEILLSIFFVVNSSAYVNAYVNMKWIGSYYLYGEVTCVVNNVLYKLKVKVSDYRYMTDSTKWTITVSTV